MRIGRTHWKSRRRQNIIVQMLLRHFFQICSMTMMANVSDLDIGCSTQNNLIRIFSNLYFSRKSFYSVNLSLRNPALVKIWGVKMS